MTDLAGQQADRIRADRLEQELDAANARIADLEQRLRPSALASLPIVADSPFRVMMEQIGEGALTLQRNGLITYCNSRFAEMLQVERDGIIGSDLHVYLRAADHLRFDQLLDGGLETTTRGEFVLTAEGGTSLPIALSLSPLRRYAADPLICAVTADLTDQKQQDYTLHEAIGRLEAESLRRGIVEEALRQSQKMEAIGQLTGGLAHDFNNLLTAILGALEQIQSQIAQGRTDRLARYADAAREAADRAAALTHRLLAFARRQPLDPREVSPARLMAGMEELIRRTVGPRITVTMATDAATGLTLCDGNQLENALLNLAINARDAMPQGGHLRLAVGEAVLSAEQATLRDLPAGRYLSIEVGDDGEGMTPEVAARAFDPFFTTKPVGQGTGLGLSTIYGFARQSGGQAEISTVHGEGTTITLLLPEVAPVLRPEADGRVPSQAV